MGKYNVMHVLPVIYVSFFLSLLRFLHVLTLLINYNFVYYEYDICILYKFKHFYRTFY
jgi:hypothetical protein